MNSSNYSRIENTTPPAGMSGCGTSGSCGGGQNKSTKMNSSNYSRLENTSAPAGISRCGTSGSCSGGQTDDEDGSVDYDDFEKSLNLNSTMTGGNARMVGTPVTVTKRTVVTKTSTDPNEYMGYESTGLEDTSPFPSTFASGGFSSSADSSYKSKHFSDYEGENQRSIGGMQTCPPNWKPRTQYNGSTPNRPAPAARSGGQSYQPANNTYQSANNSYPSANNTGGGMGRWGGGQLGQLSPMAHSSMNSTMPSAHFSDYSGVEQSTMGGMKSCPGRMGGSPTARNAAYRNTSAPGYLPSQNLSGNSSYGRSNSPGQASGRSASNRGSPISIYDSPPISIYDSTGGSSGCGPPCNTKATMNSSARNRSGYSEYERPPGNSTIFAGGGVGQPSTSIYSSLYRDYPSNMRSCPGRLNGSDLNWPTIYKTNATDPLPYSVANNVTSPGRRSPLRPGGQDQSYMSERSASPRSAHSPMNNTFSSSVGQDQSYNSGRSASPRTAYSPMNSTFESSGGCGQGCGAKFHGNEYIGDDHYTSGNYSKLPMPDSMIKPTPYRDDQIADLSDLSRYAKMNTLPAKLPWQETSHSTSPARPSASRDYFSLIADHAISPKSTKKKTIRKTTSSGSMVSEEYEEVYEIPPEEIESGYHPIDKNNITNYKPTNRINTCKDNPQSPCNVSPCQPMNNSNITSYKPTNRINTFKDMPRDTFTVPAYQPMNNSNITNYKTPNRTNTFKDIPQDTFTVPGYQPMNNSNITNYKTPNRTNTFKDIPQDTFTVPGYQPMNNSNITNYKTPNRTNTFKDIPQDTFNVSAYNPRGPINNSTYTKGPCRCSKEHVEQKSTCDDIGNPCRTPKDKTEHFPDPTVSNSANVLSVNGPETANQSNEPVKFFQAEPYHENTEHAKFSVTPVNSNTNCVCKSNMDPGGVNLDNIEREEFQQLSQNLKLWQQSRRKVVSQMNSIASVHNNNNNNNKIDLSKCPAPCKFP